MSSGKFRLIIERFDRCLENTKTKQPIEEYFILTIDDRRTIFFEKKNYIKFQYVVFG
ncbi:hypothetical protein CHBEV_321 [Choristoneura biennis entomopoxvirus]|uniref:Uncharacterized protein n=1 Tax=Choristoneura biennis entomopoxvirus TaxID=10288 RepID=A0A916P1K3_CBEPV|nr:hypothetical protein CHBEV_014 [Choristoneura biennis entomopoxvirus]YP_008004391.1 hypothetical protein CHBEV_321 [Choristoneura biennis entomopoxvirus]CCU55582.1 hypothetical protein CHBEV_014 [Choristoneura biennis entomopoxvirus]CCU55889.1 hypothetical protein CHBEV_321 [Choristoneura biennis entomopoxvirus]